MTFSAKDLAHFSDMDGIFHTKFREVVFGCLNERLERKLSWEEFKAVFGCQRVDDGGVEGRRSRNIRFVELFIFVVSLPHYEIVVYNFSTLAQKKDEALRELYSGSSFRT